MIFLQVLFAIFSLVNHALAKGYGIGAGGFVVGYGSGYGEHTGFGVAKGQVAEIPGYGSVQRKSLLKPHAFNYQVPSDSGSGHFRKEQGDGNGNIQGSYGYMGHQGVYRRVDYVADQSGFRAKVKTNEPGTDGKENPADITMNVQQPPGGVQGKYMHSSVINGYGTSGSHLGFGYDGFSLFHGIPRSKSGKSGN